MFSMKRIAELIMMYLRNELSFEDEHELLAWRTRSQGNEDLFEELTDPETLKKTIRHLMEVDHEKGWQEMKEKMRQRGIIPPQ